MLLSLDRSTQNRSTRKIHVVSCYFPFVLFGMAAPGLLIGGLWCFLPLAFVFIVVPLLDAAAGPAILDYEKLGFSSFEQKIMRLAPPLFMALYVPFLGAFLYLFSTRSYAEQGGMILSMGGIGSVAIAAAHEVFHKRDHGWHWLAKLTLVLTFYTPFELTHIYGHHAHACTKQDMSSGRAGESLFAFIGRWAFGVHRLLWKIIDNRYGRQPLIMRVGRFACFVLAPLAAAALTTGVAGPAAGLLLIGQAAIAVLISETINYIGHYGILAESGHVAWEANQRYSGYLTFLTQRHSDHHRHATKPFFLLKPTPLPTLPIGYPLLILIAWFPPLWHRLMAAEFRRWALNP